MRNDGSTWIGMGALALLSAGHWLRDHLHAPPHALKFLLGVWPNFVAPVAIAFIALPMFRGRQTEEDTLHTFGWVLGFSTLGVLAWELMQTQSNGSLVFDVNDVLATFRRLLCVLGRGQAALRASQVVKMRDS